MRNDRSSWLQRWPCAEGAIYAADARRAPQCLSKEWQVVQISRQHGRSAALRPFTLRRKATRQPPDSFRLTAAASHLPGLLLPNLGPQHGRHRRVAAAAAGALGPWEHRPEAQGLVARARDHRLTVRRHGQVQHLRTQQTHHQSAAEPPGPTALPAPPSLHPCTAAAAHWRAAGAGQAPGTPPPPTHTHPAQHPGAAGAPPTHPPGSCVPSASPAWTWWGTSTPQSGSGCSRGRTQSRSCSCSTPGSTPAAERAAR